MFPAACWLLLLSHREGEGAVIQDTHYQMDSCLRYWPGDQVEVEAHMSAPLAILEVSKVDLVEHSSAAW